MMLHISACFQFFSGKVGKTIKHYGDKGTNGFKGCEPTVKFIHKINDLADAMTSRTPREALYADPKLKHQYMSRMLAIYASNMAHIPTE